MNTKRIPPITASFFQACHYCFKHYSAANPLSRCANCMHVVYCGKACQIADWPVHKEFCRAYRAVERSCGAEILRLYSFVPVDPVTGVVTNSRELAGCLGEVATVILQNLEEELERQPRRDERYLVAWEPRCLACGHSEATFRMQGKRVDVLPCRDCGLSFYCSSEHWDAVKYKHQKSPCQDGRNNLSQCSMNKLSFHDVRFAQVIENENVGEFEWAPERTMTSWSSIQLINWSDFSNHLSLDYSYCSKMDREFLKALIRASSENLSMPMTILWGLEVLNPDAAWTRKHVLNIHVLGAAEKELSKSHIFEEILHRVPLVKTLKLTFIGPDLEQLTGSHSSVIPIDTCDQCSCTGRKIIHEFQPKTYHQYITDQGINFRNPDLAVAFNSVCSREHVVSWTTTYHALCQRRIPSIFTAYNREEALAEAFLFKGVGIVSHWNLAPKPNPWGSLISKIEPNGVVGFYANNAWISGAFR
ncbi:hypothetical protein CPB84DRAFT_1966999 [Gymnopilus junonius]|uniref:MYND-type domain-containing protein n=1 Tax=Gymnopilus junonius TaxID=109634 RepID=A0A9P5NBR3_GYMJU|nr:hypothetical protein CPB84DRAFT_1966999 [Gymnopilus junonius]